MANKHFKMVLVVLFMLFVVTTSAGYIYRTDNCTAYRKTLPCGEGKCCCKATTASCIGFGQSLTYIPRLPKGITLLTFRDNFLPNLNSDSFSGVSVESLINVYLSNNSIVNVSPDAFSGLVNMERLTLDGNNKINHLKLSASFGNVQKTSNFHLSLKNIGMTELLDSTFSNFNNSNISRIYLNNNRIQLFDVKAFHTMRTLAVISIANNNVQEISKDLSHTSVTHVYLNRNKLEAPNFCSGTDESSLFPNLIHLDLSYNNINEVTANYFRCLNTLRELTLSGNSMKVIHTNAFSGLPYLNDLLLANGKIETIEKYAFNNSHLTHLNMKQNYIPFKADTARDIFKYSRNLRILDISLNNLKYLSDKEVLEMFSPLRQLRTLTACHMQLKDLENSFLKHFPYLTALNLDGNSFSTIGTPFQNVYGLKTLSLQGNNINILTEASLSDSFLNSIQRLNLANNPFDCTCSLLLFRSMISDIGKIGNISLTTWPRRYLCFTPTKMRKVELINYRPTKSSCRNNLLIASVCLSVVLVITAVALVLSYKYRWYIAYWIYKLKNKRRCPERQPLLNPGDVQFDGYVIYHSEDSTFVHNDLRLLMEKKHTYSLHIWERNAPGSGAKLEAMVDGIYASKNVIAVVSKHSIQDSWFQFQLDVAFDRQVQLRRDFVILVILENFDFQELNKYWCVMFTKQSTARWCTDQTGLKHAVFEQQMEHHFNK